MSKFHFLKKIKIISAMAILMAISLGTIGFTASFADGSAIEKEIKPKSERHDKKGPHGKHHMPPMDTDKVKAKIQAAVENGKLTQEEADEKLLLMQKNIKKGPHGKYHKSHMDIDKVKAKIQAAVENGKLTQEEADEKLLLMQKNIKKGPHGKYHKVD